ncbi:nudix hydrolase 16, mitochondrial isoform X1 [Beta vulgaris subsp. vulgaris]|uniref:nudix hydrolase 16, mitochondrial isoform X1 n=1 Tax=Beta vulgaris subsp. vulgaris TaxID=3555 RepID=UPI00203668ED|nr:nudix hydrolase 16, mitochondrial isoform X1 [Beta vulgaris subsp. vulgaris]
MSDLVARTGRLHQRYNDGCRLVAGCIPFRYRNGEDSSNDDPESNIEVLMINSQSGPGLLFPKGGWENDETVEEAAAREAVEEAGVRGDLMDLLGYYKFKSKTHQDEFCPEGLCKAAMFALLVKEELESWPEQSTRNRIWLSVPEAAQSCRHAWMRVALVDGFLKWHGDKFVERDEKRDGSD